MEFQTRKGDAGDAARFYRGPLLGVLPRTVSLKTLLWLMAVVGATGVRI